MNLIIVGGTIVTMRSKGIVKDGALVIQEGKIVDVGKTSELKGKCSRYGKIDVRGKVVVSGLTDTHQHAAISLLREYADDYPLEERLEKWIWPPDQLTRA